MTTATSTRTPAASRDLPLLPLSEIALAAVSLFAVLGLRRAFLGTEWFPELAIQVIAAHGLAALLRRRGVSMPLTLVAMFAAGFVAITWIHAGDAAAFGIPTGDSLRALGQAIDDAGTAFSEVKAPTDALPGFLIASSVAIWFGATLADWAAFRVEAPLEATLPSATLFVLTAVLGADVDRVLLAVMWTVAVLAFLLLRRADRLGHTATWVGDRRRTGPRTMLLVGGALMAAAVLVAAVVAPRLPGAESEAILSLTDLGDDGPGTRTTVSPLVDIRSRLVDQADVEVFSVRSPVRSYWRLTSLDRFDGNIWSSSGSYGSAEGDLDDGVPVESERITFEQSFAINALAQIWLPAAYEPQSVQSGVDLRYDEVSGTLIIDDDDETATSDNTDYRVTSALPQHQPDALASATDQVPEDIAERYLGLPDDFPADVRALAQDLTVDATSGYDAARRLQDFFRDNFTYDLEVGAGHSESAIEDFVLAERRGYCEQFAGSFAAMARSIGLPARVAVGFTPGSNNPADPTLYRVRGEHAHAWPEVYLGEYGWVLFEPTPGRGAPFAESYTDVPESQATTGDGTTATTAVAPPPTGSDDTTPTSDPERDTVNPDELESGGVDGAADGGPNPWFGRLAWAAVLLVAVVALYLVTVLAVAAWRRRRRRHAAVEPDQQVALAWDESLGAVRRAGVPVRDSETQTEVATRVSQRLPAATEPMSALATAVQGSTFSSRLPDEETASEAKENAAEVERIANASMSRGDRLRARVHPRRFIDD